jgi:copper oxidase (laccase) domain-containing protein
MTREFDSLPSDVIVQLSPCIRPPHYEIDFAADIVRTCRESGATNVHDCGVCTPAISSATTRIVLRRGRPAACSLS